MRAANAFAAWIAGAPDLQDSPEATAKAAQSGDPAARRLLERWIRESGFPFTLHRARGASPPPGSWPAVTRKEIVTALRHLVQVRRIPHAQIRRARVNDVDLRGRVWRLRLSGFWRPRPVDLSDEDVAAIKTLAKWARGERPAPDAPLLMRKDGRPWSPRMLYHAAGRWPLAAGAVRDETNDADGASGEGEM